MYINFWYPVGLSEEITNEEPFRAQILGLKFVAYRDKEGKAHVLSDTCVHRGGSLSKGWVKDEGGIRLTGPRIANQAFGSHQRVQVYYSPSMAAWLKDKSGPPPVGARMVKEMFVDFPGENDDRDGVAFMQRIDDESADGWLWALFFRPNSPSTGRKTGFISVQRGVSFCQSCHGVVADGKLRF